ncbi:MAG: hypothetical protein HKN71_10080 [Gemmatimonadetes bacterium]|nr:hypothetical protein [Gemmatimonadota bacterium]
MDPLLSTLALVVLALLGARFSFSTERVPAGPRLLFRTGTHFLFLGALVGPALLGLIDDDAVLQLYPLLGLGLGWVGLLFGLQLDRRTLGQFPLGFHLIAFGQALVTLIVFAGVGLLAAREGGLFGPSVDALVLAAAATAAVSSPAGVAMVSSNFLVRGQVRQFLFFVASLDAVVGLLALQLTYGYLHGTELMSGFDVGGTTFWTGADLALGLVCGVLFLWLMRLRPGREELVLYLLGVSALVGGAALQLQLSPLVAATVTGAVVANFSRHRDRVYRALQQWEQPIYVVLLVLAGAQLRPTTWWVLPLGLGYFVVRGLGKVLGTALLVRVIPLPFDVPRRLGLGLIPQGGISLAMALSLVLTLSGTGTTVAGYPAVDLLFAVIVVGVVLSELAGPSSTQGVLRRAGELKPGVEAALEEGDDRRAEAVAMGREPGDDEVASDASPPHAPPS